MIKFGEVNGCGYKVVGGVVIKLMSFKKMSALL
jgi:hypothetical protein